MTGQVECTHCSKKTGLTRFSIMKGVYTITCEYCGGNFTMKVVVSDEEYEEFCAKYKIK